MPGNLMLEAFSDELTKLAVKNPFALTKRLGGTLEHIRESHSLPVARATKIPKWLSGKGAKLPARLKEALKRDGFVDLPGGRRLYNMERVEFNLLRDAKRVAE